MAKRRLPPRYKSGPKKGQFMPKGARRKAAPRKAAPRKAAPRRRSAPRAQRRSYRRNPARPDPVRMLTRGVFTATQVLLGKAGARAVPELMNLPRSGNAGLAVQVATALALGYATEMFFSKATASAVLAGGLTAPVETLLVSANIPYVSSYLSPAATQAAVAGYVQPGKGVAGYVPHAPGATGLGSGRGGGAGDASEEYPAMWT